MSASDFQLSSKQRKFLQWVAEAAFANPFSPERERIDYQIAGVKRRVSDEKLRGMVLTSVDRCLRNIKVITPAKRRETQDRVANDEDRLIETARLFLIYHRYQIKFDCFIESQIEADDNPLVLPFAKELLADLDGLGLRRGERLRYVALFYQIRRAYYFISENIGGNSSAIVEVRMRLWNNLFTFNSNWYLDHLCERMENFSTLLLGETGTGKGAAAYAIGCAGFIPFDEKQLKFKESFTRSFQSVNLSQYSSNLIESELFGHKKGAFTGAVENHQGLFARSSPYGAVFIDEIGEIDIQTQIKLLSVLQDRIFTPVGSHQRLRVNGRVIAATNQDVDALRNKGVFRDDFYYRLCSDVIEMPLLSTRIKEDPNELRTILNGLVKKTFGVKSEVITDEVERCITKSLPNNYSWPGNVRELEQCVRRICLTGCYKGDRRQIALKPTFIDEVAEGSLSSQQLLSGYCRELYKIHRTFEAVSQITGMDRRTVKKYIDGEHR